MDKHPLGKYGCYTCVVGASIIVTITMFIQAVISYERRKVITKVTIHTFHYRVYILLALSVFCPVVFWIIYFNQLEGSSYHAVRLDRNSTETIEVCVPSSLNYVGRNEIVFTLFGFFIPTSIILFNYWSVDDEGFTVFIFIYLFFVFFFRPIWKQAYKGARTARGNAATASPQSLQMRMALVMSVTVMEFFVFQLPMSAIVLMAIFQTLFGPLVMQTNMTALCLCLWFVDSIINPLWTNLLSKKRNNNVTSSNIQESRVTSGTTAAE